MVILCRLMSTKIENQKRASEVRGISFPPGLKKQIEVEAKRSYRSFTQQVLFLVQRGLEELEKASKEADRD